MAGSVLRQEGPACNISTGRRVPPRHPLLRVERGEKCRRC